MAKPPKGQNGRSLLSRRPPTIADIAKLSGVSPTTVSRSLAGVGRISDETRVRVANAAKELGYKVNRLARSLRLQRSGVILVLIPDLANENYSDLLAHLDRFAYERGYSIMIGHTGVNVSRSDRLADELFTGGIDGIILTSIYCPSRLREHLAAGESLAVMRALSPTASDEGIVGVQIDERRAAYDVVRHLIDNGYRRIAHLSGPMDELAAQLRYAGWKDALADAGLAVRQVVGEGFGLNDGRDAARSMMSAGTLPDAVFCASDLAAFGLITELREHGIPVPDSLAVAGFDDLPFSVLFSPPLTTIRLPRKEIASAAIQHLVAQINGEPVPASIIVPHQLITRLSTRPKAS